MAAFVEAPPLCAQGRSSKVPIVGKLKAGNKRQAYSGRVQSLNLKQSVLNVDSLHGQDSEIFPIKKNVRVENLGGERLKLSALKPGTPILIYYEQKSGERTVKNIIVLGSARSKGKGAAPSS